VLSGFLITSILIGEKRSSTYYRDFYWKRALRILPLYWVTLGGVWIFLHQTAHTLMALAFVVNFAGIAHVLMIEPGPFWSLGIEEQFYVLWPTFVRRFNVKQIFRCSIAVGLACVGCRALLALHGHHDYQLTPLRCDGLAFGAALACYFFTAPTAARRRRLDALLWGLMALGGVLIATRSHLPGRLGLMYYPAFQTGVVLITGPIIGLAISHSGLRWLAPLRSRVLTFFGLISYAFYMVHVYVIRIYQHFLGALAPGDVRGYWTEAAVTFAASVALAVLSRYVLELPAMRLRKYVLRRPNLNAEHAHPPLPLAGM
jgi:peptidoglycan/LPS O-acetylase OafA/YrhL